MFKYNHFWHWWFQLDNRHYLKVAFASLISALPFVAGALFFPLLWKVVVALPLAAGGIIIFCTKLSDFFYERQKNRLERIQRETPDEILKEEIDLYLNRRVVCPPELLQGNHLNLPHDIPRVERAVENALFIPTDEDILAIEGALKDMEEEEDIDEDMEEEEDVDEDRGEEEEEDENDFSPDKTIVLERFCISEQFYIKECRGEKVFSNDAAREMAELFGLESLMLPRSSLLIQTQEKPPKILYIQKLVPEAQSGSQIMDKLFGLEDITISESPQENFREEAKKIIKEISLSSFQEIFLLQLVLGVQWGHSPGIFLGKSQSGERVLYNTELENIMPEDNYNVPKTFPFISEEGEVIEKDVKNVFPFRLWLAGWPQANVPFFREIVEKSLYFINPEQLLAYHRQKRLFSSAAVGSQLDRVLLIRNLFEEEVKKPKIILTPKELFLRFINNHPTYAFLSELSLCDLSKFSLLGQVPEGADMNFFRHPLQWISMKRIALKDKKNIEYGKSSMLEEDANTRHVCHVLCFEKVKDAKKREEEKKSEVEALDEISNQLRS